MANAGPPQQRNSDGIQATLTAEYPRADRQLIPLAATYARQFQGVYITGFLTGDVGNEAPVT